MFKVNDTIIYGSEGVCQILGIEEKDFIGAKKTYYVIKPVASSSSTIFVPIDSEVLVAKMRSLMSKKEINELIDSLQKEAVSWIENERERKEAYKNILSGGNPIELLNMIRTIHLEKENRETTGKRLHLIDESFLRDAEKCLYSEFQHVLNLRQDEVIPYIINRIEKHK